MALYTFTVEEAEISVFPTDSDGVAITDTPLWIGLNAENIQLTSSLEEIEDRPSGMPYPEVHHGAESHEITIGRLWETDVPGVTQPSNLSELLAVADLVNNPPAQNAIDYRLTPNRVYVVVIKWSEELDPDKFIYRVYYGVTDRSYELSGNIDSGMQASHKWRAAYYLTGN